jgi:hypothetical protein
MAFNLDAIRSVIRSWYRRLFIAACAVACRVGPFGVREQHEREPYTATQRVVMWVGASVAAALMLTDLMGMQTNAIGGAIGGGAGAAAMVTLLYGRASRSKRS